MRTRLSFVSMAVALLFASCGDSPLPDDCTVGTENCACDRNRSCNPDLTCAGEVCVPKAGAGGSEATAGEGGASGGVPGGEGGTPVGEGGVSGAAVGGSGGAQPDAGAAGAMSGNGASGNSGTGGSLPGGTGGSATGGSSGSGGSGGSFTAGIGGIGDSGGSSTAGIGGSSGSGGSECDPTCDVPNGVVVRGCRRFLFGINYPWKNRGEDFSGLNDVGNNSLDILRDLQDMQANGVNVVRWFIWPDFTTSLVRFDADGTPTGIASATAPNLAAALFLAEQARVNIQFTLFSYENFWALGGDPRRSLAPIITDPMKRAALMDTVVRPVVTAVTNSAYASRCVGWDVIHEPEWAMTGSNGYGDPPYEPVSPIHEVTHPEMETFVADTIATIRSASDLPVTVGSLAAKWPRAWSRVDIDFYTIHIYDWVDTGGWPFNRTPAELGYTGKPLVMGGFPIAGLRGNPVLSLAGGWYTNGYAGALAWSFTGNASTWRDTKSSFKAFADSRGCRVQF